MIRFLKNDNFIVGFDPEKGVIKSLKHADHDLEFAANEDNSPHLNVPGSRWFGDLIFSVRHKNQIQKYYTSISGKHRKLYFSDSIKVKYSKITSPDGNDLDLKVTKKFYCNKKGFQWEIILQNCTGSDIEIGEFGIPFAFNNLYKGLPQKQLYEKRVISHFSPSGHCSYLIAQGLNGESPLLLFTPCGDTYFEAASHEKNEPFQGMGLKWEGIKIGYIYSKFPVESGEWKEWFNGHSSKVLKNEETGTYSFRFSWAENRNMLIRQLVRLGKIAVRVHPGMVLPENMDMLLKLETKNNIDNIDIPGYFEKVNIGDNKYKFRFKDTGIKKVTIRYDKNKWTNLIFFVTDKIDTLIKKRAGFIVKNQQYNNRKDGRFKAFLMWDAETGSVVSEARSSYLVGGSDELGFADPLFLAYKNIFYPVKSEITALGEYIDRFIIRKLQNRNDYGVRLWNFNDK